MILAAFVIPGAPRTKKNHGRIVSGRKGKTFLPSKAYMDWDDAAQIHLAKIRAGTVGYPISVPVNVEARIFRDREVGDAVNYFQAIADTLEKGRILVNDSQIRSWDGSRLLKCEEEPRVVVTIETIDLVEYEKG